MKRFFKNFIILSVIVAFSNWFAQNGRKDASEDERQRIMVLLIFACIMSWVLIKLLIYTSEQKRIYKQQKMKTLQENKEQGIIKRYPPLVHIAGLDIPENIQVSVILKNDKLVISGAGKEYNLSRDKIVSTESQITVDIKEFYKSSTLKGVTGAVLFGLPGAVVGSAATKKVVKSDIKCFAIISFTTNSGDTAAIVLSDVMTNTRYSQDLSFRLKPAAKKIETINL